MKIRVIVPGATRLAWAAEGIALYTKRAKAWIGVEWIEVPAARKGEPKEKAAQEGREMLRRLTSVGYTVVLDERGRRRDSQSFAKLVDQRMLDGRDLTFLVGGAEGISPEVRDRADLVLSLSDLTLPHDLARLMLAEQIYRALAILKNHPYPR